MMTTKVAAREGFRWFREGARMARRHALAWVLRSIVLVLGGTAVGLAIGAVFGVLTNVAPATGPWVSFLVPLVTTALTGLLLMTAWWFAMREAGDAPTRQDWRRAAPPAMFWLLAPTLVVWLFTRLLHLAMGDTMAFFSVTTLLSRLLSFWPMITLVVGGVLLDQVRARPSEAWYSLRPWQTALHLFRRHWAPLLTGWLLPWLLLSTGYMLIMVAIAAWIKSMGVPVDAQHINSGLAWTLRLFTVGGLFAIGLVSNLALVIGYLQIRGGEPALTIPDAERSSPSTDADHGESFPPLL